MRKIIAVLVLGLIAFPASVGAQGTGDYSSGQGIWDDDGTPRSVGWEIVGNEATGDADGEFDVRSRDGSLNFHADVTCIEVDGDEAWFELDVEPADGIEDYEVYAVDNVQGNGGPRGGDTFGLKEEDDDNPLTPLIVEDEDCEQDRNNDEDNIRGDIFNIDGE